MSSPTTDTRRLLRYMPSVQRQQNDLRLVEAAWDSLALLSSLSPITSRTSSGNDLGRARKDFSALSAEMVHGLTKEAMSNVVHDLNSKAQVGIDILVRNLFERTADIGFLATDEVLTRYVSTLGGSAVAPPTRSEVEQRLADYTSYYSVYRSVQVFDSALSPVAQHGNHRLDTDRPLAAADAHFLTRVLHSDAAYTEYYGLLPFLDEKTHSLVYAKRLLDGQTPVGVLCLQFRMDDELPNLFDVLLDDGRNTAIVLALLDEEHRVIGSSDALQLPAGWKMPPPDKSAGIGNVIRHMGREYLACHASGQSFEGYSGPRWSGLAVVPLDLAFEQADETPVSSPLMEEVAGHNEFLSGDLQKIPERSTAIQTALERSVWNGLLDVNRVEVTGDMGQSDIQFAKTLLSEIGSTAQKTARAFASALHDLHRVVTHAMVGDAQHRATMAMQILDRNLYERANDCRWWALTPSLVRALQSNTQSVAEATKTLSHINDLYTVYSGIVLYDQHGHVVAVSRQHLEHLLGQPLDEPWVKRSLGLDMHRYTVSEWTYTCLQPEGKTFVYAAVLRDPEQSARPLGGIGLVWNSGSQLGSILRDCAAGSDPKDSFVLCDTTGNVVQAQGQSCAERSLRTAMSATRDLPTGETIADLDGTLYGVGASLGVGYREFRAKDGYNHGLQCAVLHHLCTRQPHSKDWRGLKVSRSPGRHDADSIVRLASFTASGHWLSIHGESVLFAAPDTQILSATHLKHPMVGMAQINDRVYPVLDLRCAIVGTQAANSISRAMDVTRQMIVIRVPLQAGDHADVAVRIDTLTAILEVDSRSMQRMSQPATGMVDQVVGVNMEGINLQNNDGARQMLLMVVSRAWLQQCAQGAQGMTLAQDLGALTNH